MALNNLFQIPKDGLAGLRENWRSDFGAALIVFTFTLPFCLSIALAAQLPFVSGFISAIVGGLVISFLSGSCLTIKMPGLSLTPILIIAVTTLGSGYLSTGYKYTFALIVVAGLIQFGLGLFRLGEWLNTIPEAIIYGLLATLGLHIIILQLHFLLGIQPDTHDLLTIIRQLPYHILYESHWHLILVGISSLFVLFVLSSIKYRLASVLPTPLIVIFFGIFLSYYLDIPHIEGRDYLIQVPYNYKDFFLSPDFSKIWIWQSLEIALIIVLVSSMESIINIKSIDSLDFYRRRSKLNRELMAIGIGNTLCGFLGGLPLISSFEHSSTNINTGAKTRWANFINGLLLLTFCLLAFKLIKLLPLATLAAINIYMAYLFISPKIFKDIKSIGIEQFSIFLITLVATLFGGILLGFIIGYIAYLLIFAWMNRSFRSLFSVKVKIVNYNDKRSKVMVRSIAIASNYMSLKRQLAQIPPGGQIYLDFAKSKIVDYSFLELIYHHPYHFNNNEGSIELQGLDDHYAMSAHPLSTRLIIENPRLQSNNAHHLDERQLDVLAVASVNNSKLRPNLTYDGNKLQGYNFTLGFEIKYRKNKFNKNYQSDKHKKTTRIEFSDIFLSRGLRMSDQSLHMSIVLIENIQIYVPAFNLSKEVLLGKVKQRIGYEEIYFDSFPDFSQYYYLKGIHHAEIRDFFTDRLLDFLVQNQDFNIESRNNQIVIYRDMRLMSQVEIADCIYFAEGLLENIYQEEESSEEIELSLPQSS